MPSLQDTFTSYKTTIIGVVTLVAAACSVILSVSEGGAIDLAPILAALTGLGFLASKDSDK